MVEIRLFKTISPREKVTKSLTDEKVLSGTFRDSTDALNPYIEVGTDPTGYNYAYVPAFERYYFVTGIRYVRHGLWALTLTVDVLMTYSAQILELYGNLEGAENEDPYSSSAIYNADVRTDATKTDFPYSFERQNDMVMVALVGAPIPAKIGS